jgi:large subunit ribosomal protein L5
MLGFQATITLSRPGLRIKHRKIKKSTVPKHHRINQSEAIDYMEKEFKVSVE